MVEIWTCTIPGKPQRKRAHKTTMRGGYFDPDKHIKMQLSDWIFENVALPDKPFDSAISMTTVSFFQVPAGLSKKEREERLLFGYAWQKKIDTDNIEKLHRDILCYGQLEGRIMTDDKLICCGKPIKLWTEDDERVVIKIESLRSFYEKC